MLRNFKPLVRTKGGMAVDQTNLRWAYGTLTIALATNVQGGSMRTDG